jgi:hypothetical protein
VKILCSYFVRSWKGGDTFLRRCEAREREFVCGGLSDLEIGLGYKKVFWNIASRDLLWAEMGEKFKVHTFVREVRF